MSGIRYKVSVEPAEEPVTLEELKLHLKVSNTADDALITSLGKTARIFVEDLTDKKLITQTIEFYLDKFPASRSIILPVSPLSAVVIEYIDAITTDLSYTTWDAANYNTDFISRYPRISTRINVAFPSTQEEFNAVKLTLTCGYGLAADVPDIFKSAIKELVAEMYENRENRMYTFGTSGYNVPNHVVYLLMNNKDLGFYVQ